MQLLRRLRDLELLNMPKELIAQNVILVYWICVQFSVILPVNRVLELYLMCQETPIQCQNNSFLFSFPCAKHSTNWSGTRSQIKHSMASTFSFTNFSTIFDHSNFRNAKNDAKALCCIHQVLSKTMHPQGDFKAGGSSIKLHKLWRNSEDVTMRVNETILQGISRVNTIISHIRSYEDSIQIKMLWWKL